MVWVVPVAGGFVAFVMAVFRRLVYIEILGRRTSTLGGQAERVVQNLPRVQLGKFGFGERRSDRSQ